MTEMVHRGARKRSGWKVRLLTAGVLLCGVVLLPASSAFAQEEMPAMKDGMLCPHAVGDASNPATAAPPTRSAPNETPLGAKPSSLVTHPSPGRAATTPATKAPAERASATQPAATPATTTARTTAAAGAAVQAVQPQRAVAPVAQPSARPQHVTTPRAHVRTTTKHSPAARHSSAPAQTTTVIPEVTRPSAGTAPQLTTTATGTQPADTTWLAIGGVLMLMAFAAAVVVLRRCGGGDATVTAVGDGPLEPRTEIDEVEVALRELLSEARAKELLGSAESDVDATDAPFALR
jgi:hypothetical protein